MSAASDGPNLSLFGVDEPQAPAPGFVATVPPTGPQTAPPTRAAGSFAAYASWRASAEGAAVFTEIEATALALVWRGARRIGVRALLEDARMKLRLQINNSWGRYVADELVNRHAELLHAIERRRRRV